MKISDVTAALDEIAPPSLAADWDNVGLLVGDPAGRVRRLMLCIDLTADVLAEAVRSGTQMVMAYHPVIFRPIPRVTAPSVAFEAVRRGVAVYSSHTALDAAPGGTNDCLADVLGLVDRRPLEAAEADGECKVVVFVPQADLAGVSEAAFAAGAGRIGAYSGCSFHAAGTGTFFGEAGANPAVGRPGRREAVGELRLEMVCPKARIPAVLAAVRAAHSYEEPAIDVYSLAGYPAGFGMGRIGRLARPVSAAALIRRVKRKVGLKQVLVAGPGAAGGDEVVTVAACGAGSCGSMFRAAAAQGATFWLTGEMRHHDALAAAAAGLTAVCLGHSNSERMTLGPLARRLREALPGLDVAVSAADRDPFEIV